MPQEKSVCVCVRGWHLQSFLKEHESLRDEYVSLCVRLNFSVWISITLHNTTHTTWFVLMGLHEHHYYVNGIQHTAVYWYTLVHGCTTLSLSLTLLKSIIRFGCFRIYFCIWVLHHTRSCMRTHTHARTQAWTLLSGRLVIGRARDLYLRHHISQRRFSLSMYTHTQFWKKL